MTEESGGIGLTQKAIHPNVFRLNPDRLCEIADADRPFSVSPACGSKIWKNLPLHPASPQAMNAWVTFPGISPHMATPWQSPALKKER
jgi:hypothetical protein